jgi:RHS repeat-associated protein
MVAYSNVSPTPQLNMYLYGPNGKVLSKFLYEPSGSAWDAVPASQTNYFYLGGKALNWAENNIGSTTTAQFWPYGQTVGGSGGGVFATYQPDSSGFLYADQRYYNSGWGRYLTADPSDANVNLSISGSFNRFAYVNGDPANGSDPHGTSDCPGDSCGNDGNGSNNGGDGDGGYPGLCDPSDPSGLSCLIGGLAGTNGSGPAIPSLTLGEATQLETLMQQGIINGWTLTPTGVDLSLLPAAATCQARSRLSKEL